jgi:hypothetical protein
MNASSWKGLNEKGMALITTMLIMAAAGVIAIAVSIDNTVETRIAANQKNTEVAFRNAEAGLEHARLRLGGLFSTAPLNLTLLQSNQSPNWTFFFQTDTPSQDQERDSRWIERKVDLGSSDSNYKVFARDAHDPSGQMLILRSVGFGPGGAQQTVELRVAATGLGTHSGYYAQEGGGPTKANVNLRDRDRVDGGQISPGYTLR